MIMARTQAVRMTSSMSWRITSNKTWRPRNPTRFTVGDWCILAISSRVTPSADTGTIIKSQHLTWTCKINLCNAEFRQTYGHFGSIYEYQCFHDDHDDVMQRKGFPHLLPFGKPRASGYKGPVTWSSSVLFDISLNSGWTNSRVDDDLKGRGTHVTSHQHRFLFRLSEGVTKMPDEILRHFTCQCGTERTHMQGFILHVTDM